MSLNRQIASQIYYGIGIIIEKIAIFFGYPDNPGMPVFSRFSDTEQLRLEKLPMHEVRFPPEPVPDNLIEVLLGVIPKTDTIKRVFYESPSEGYYNFYIQNFKNAYFLPDQLSEIIQIFFKVCLDTSGLEAIREVLFISLIAYYNILNLRLCMYWFLSINPYTYPWLFLVYLVDWTEDILQGLVPVVAGVNLTATFWFILIGKVADSLNHLVFTMPFLPSEAQRAQTIINGQVENILLFRFLPILWFRKTIPNEIREFWYYDRPDILKFMQEAYGQLDLKLLPDSIVFSMNEKETISLQKQVFKDSELKTQLFKQQIKNTVNQGPTSSSDNLLENSLSKLYPDENSNCYVIFSQKANNMNIINPIIKTESITNDYSQSEQKINSSELLIKYISQSKEYSESYIHSFDKYSIRSFNQSILEHLDTHKSILKQFDIHNDLLKSYRIDNVSTHMLLTMNVSEFKSHLTELHDVYYHLILSNFDNKI